MNIRSFHFLSLKVLSFQLNKVIQKSSVLISTHFSIKKSKVGFIFLKSKVVSQGLLKILIFL